MLSLAPAIKMARARVGINQEQLAARVSETLSTREKKVLITRERISTFERGVGPPFDVLIAMAESMLLTPSEFLRMAEMAESIKAKQAGGPTR